LDGHLLEGVERDSGDHRTDRQHQKEETAPQGDPQSQAQAEAVVRGTGASAPSRILSIADNDEKINTDLLDSNGGIRDRIQLVDCSGSIGNRCAGDGA